MKVIYRNKELRLPDFLIIGAARSGTSSLYFYLREHPEIFMPAFKEPHFFSFFEKSSPHPNLPPWSVESYVKRRKYKEHKILVSRTMWRPQDNNDSEKSHREGLVLLFAAEEGRL